MGGIIYNQDADSLIHNVGKRGCKLTVEGMKNYASQFRGSHMTDIMLQLNNSCASYPSKVITDLVQKYHQKLENGIEVDYTDNFWTSGAHHIFETLGIDHIAIEIETFREIGINPWISFRMNDIHDHDKETSFLLPDYFHEHPEIRRVKYHPEFIQTNADRNRDYGLKFVRDMMLAFMNEALDRYDAYGVELDFQREIEVFANGNEHDGMEIMNQFIRDVHALCGKYGEKYGHKMKLAVRVAPEVEQNYDYGLNVMQWVQEGLIDLVTIAGRFESNDNDMPVKLWKTLLAPYNVELAACIEMNILPHFGRRPIVPNMETFAACAASAYSQGADKIYMYNYFQGFENPRLDEVEPDYSCDANVSVESMAAFYKLFGDFGKVLERDRRHIISVNDRLVPWKRHRGYAQLPVSFERNREFKITVGKIPEGADTTVRLGFEDTEKAIECPPRMFVNSEACTYLGYEEDKRFSGKTVLCYSVPKSAYKSNIFVYLIANDKQMERKESATVDYLEVYIKAEK